jgi:hypothetical protein
MSLKIEVGSKEWADKQLRFSIAILQGHICRSSWKGRLNLALIVKERLLEHGFTWHAERVDNWIHRCQPKSPLAQIYADGDPGFQARELVQPKRADLREARRAP